MKNRSYLNQIQNYYRMPVSFDKIFEVKSSGFIILIFLWHWGRTSDYISKHIVAHALSGEDKRSISVTVFRKWEHIHIISGLRFRREVSCDQKRGIEPRFWTTEHIWTGRPSGTSSNTICSVSTSLATLPLSFTPRLKYLNKNNHINEVVNCTHHSRKYIIL